MAGKIVGHGNNFLLPGKLLARLLLLRDLKCSDNIHNDRTRHRVIKLYLFHLENLIISPNIYMEHFNEIKIRKEEGIVEFVPHQARVRCFKYGEVLNII